MQGTEERTKEINSQMKDKRMRVYNCENKIIPTTFFPSSTQPVLGSCQGGTIILNGSEMQQGKTFLSLINNVFFSIQASDALFNKG